jgi:SNF2 family DNA or RNA helicase
VPRHPDSFLRLAIGKYAGEKRLFLQVPTRVRLRAQALPSALWHGESKSWHVPYSPALVGPVLDAFPEDEFEYEWGEGVRDLWAAARAWRDAQDVSGRGLDSLPDVPINGSAWLHQRRAFHFARHLDAAGLFVDMGGGKTLITVGLMNHWDAKTVLVLCPKSVLGVWAREVNKWSLPGQPYDVWSSNIAGTVPRKALAMQQWLDIRRGRKVVVVVNYDSCWRNTMQDRLLAMNWDLIVCDESHRIKSASGKASKFAARLRKKSRRMLLLSGTPTPHGPDDIYAQYRAADPGIFGTNFQRFRNRYFETRKINDKVEVVHYRNGLDGFRDEAARAEFQKKMASIGIVIPRSDMVPPVDGSGVDPSRRWTMPPVLRECVLDSKTFRLYQDVKKELYAELEGGEGGEGRDGGIVVADNALTKLLRLRQITSGATRVVDPNSGMDSIQQISFEKRALLADVLEDVPSDEPIVVFGVFHSDLDAIQHVAEQVGRDYLELSGRRRDGLNPDSTLAGRRDEVVGVQLQSGGVGVDFTRACYVCYFSLDYNLGNFLQARDRLDRPGQTRPITEIHLVAVGPTGGKTVDGLTYDALLERKQLNEAVLDALRHREL